MIENTKQFQKEIEFLLLNSDQNTYTPIDNQQKTKLNDFTTPISNHLPLFDMELSSLKHCDFPKQQHIIEAQLNHLKSLELPSISNVCFEDPNN